MLSRAGTRSRRHVSSSSGFVGSNCCSLTHSRDALWRLNQQLERGSEFLEPISRFKTNVSGKRIYDPDPLAKFVDVPREDAVAAVFDRTATQSPKLMRGVRE